jgi:hypothetical protein
MQDYAEGVLLFIREGVAAPQSRYPVIGWHFSLPSCDWLALLASLL